MFTIDLEVISQKKAVINDISNGNAKGLSVIKPTNQESPHHELFLKSILDQKKDYPLPVAIASLYQNGNTIPLLTKKSFSLWQGKQKSKKTTALALMIASLLKGESQNYSVGFKGSNEGVILFFDTEQGESYAARTMKLILKLADLESSPRLIYCDLREYNPNDRNKIIEAGIQGTNNVMLVVIDGLVDLLSDFMDAGEGHVTITNILKLCSQYDIHIAGVLHQNKGDKNARAHIGTISSQKCEMQISTEIDPKDRSQSIVSCIDSRGLPFESFAIRWEKGSLPIICQGWSSDGLGNTSSNKSFDRNKELAESIFKSHTVLTHTEAINAIRNATLKSDSTAKRMLTDFKIFGLITKGEDGNYRINNKQGSRVQLGSNGVHEPCT